MSNLSTGNWTGVIASSGQQYTLEVDRGGKPATAPKGLIATTAVETQQGWLGQVVIDGEIVRESAPFLDSDLALRDANAFVIDRIKGLFA
jgi:hypothetical protein